MNTVRRFAASLRQAWRETFRKQKQVAMVAQEAKDEARWLRARLSERSNAASSGGLLGEYLEFEHEMVEAQMMSGNGPRMSLPASHLREDLTSQVRERTLGLKESQPITAQGAFGDIELALQNVEWRREVNLSWLEFSRWGIQQIILISRLRYITDPLIQRGVNVAATYVFGRGVEITTDDDDANDVLNDFIERNKTVLGQNGLTDQERRKYYDGNLFWALFTDPADGTVRIRTIDATEIQEVISDPDDLDEPQFYKRVWQTMTFDPVSGTTKYDSRTEYYPALRFDVPDGLTQIGQYPLNRDVRVHHRKAGAIAKWHFGCPIVYAALQWSRSAGRLLEACATIRKALAQFAMILTTKGGQAALQGAKNQLQTQVNSVPDNSLWDTQPTAVAGSVFASGPGTTLKAFNSRGAGGDPKDAREYKTMVAMVFGIPPTWLGDMETSNMSTAVTLDRPTELGFMEKQEAWVEDLTILCTFALNASVKAPSGRLSESYKDRKVLVMPCERKQRPDGRIVYEVVQKQADKIRVKVLFPAIREGDLPNLVKAIAEAMTLDNKGGQIIGIDERQGVLLLFQTLGVENAEEILDAMYPDEDSGKKGTEDFKPAYDPCRTSADLPAPIGKVLPPPGGQPQLPGGHQPAGPTPAPGTQPGPQTAPVVTSTEALARLLEAIRKLKETA